MSFSETFIAKVRRTKEPQRSDLWKEAVDSLDSMTTLVMVLLQMKDLTDDQRALAMALKTEAGNLATILKELRIKNVGNAAAA